MGFWQIFALLAYCAIVAFLGVYGFHRYQLLRLFYRYHPERPPEPELFAELPEESRHERASASRLCCSTGGAHSLGEQEQLGEEVINRV